MSDDTKNIDMNESVEDDANIKNAIFTDREWNINAFLEQTSGIGESRVCQKCYTDLQTMDS